MERRLDLAFENWMSHQCPSDKSMSSRPCFSLEIKGSLGLLGMLQSLFQKDHHQLVMSQCHTSGSGVAIAEIKAVVFFNSFIYLLTILLVSVVSLISVVSLVSVLSFRCFRFSFRCFGFLVR